MLTSLTQTFGTNTIMKKAKQWLYLLWRCLMVRKQSHHAYGIAVVRKDTGGIVCGFRRGEIVLFNLERNGTVTLEVPLSAELEKRNRSQGSLIKTFRCMVGVPRNHIIELLPE